MSVAIRHKSSGGNAQGNERCILFIVLIQLLVGAGLAMFIGYVFRSTIHDFMQQDADAADFFEVASTGNFEFHLDQSILINENILPVQVWNLVYRFFAALGVSPTPFWGILVNAVLVMASQFMAVVYARMVFVYDSRALIKFALLMSLNGVMMIFAGIHMRDSFLLLTATISVLVFRPQLSRSLLHGEFKKLIWLLFLMITSFLCRNEGFAVPLMIYLISIAVRLRTSAWSVKLALLLAAVIFVSLLAWLDMISLITSNYEAYKQLTMDESSQSSLGAYFLYGLPFPLSTVASAILLLFIKVPLWRSISLDSYSFCLSIAAIQMLVIAPAFLAIVWYMLFNKIQDDFKYLIYVVLSLLFMTALTSAQVRHFAIIYPFLILLYISKVRIVRGVNLRHYRAFEHLATGAVVLISILSELR